MEPVRKEDLEREIELEPATQKVLSEIAADARALKDRYLKDTIVPEGGE